MPKRGKRVSAPSRSRFPVRAVLLDACALFRLHKCDALDPLAGALEYLIAKHAHGEFAAGGPTARAALRRLEAEVRTIVPGTLEWDHFARIRGEFSTVDLGEDESIAIALTEIDRGRVVPIVTYDDGAAKKARKLGIPTLSFPETLAWMCECELITDSEAAEIEARAAARDGWKASAQTTPRDRLLASLNEVLALRPTKASKPRKRR